MKKFIMVLVLLSGLIGFNSCTEEDDSMDNTILPSQVDPGGDLDDPAEPDEED